MQKAAEINRAHLECWENHGPVFVGYLYGSDRINHGAKVQMLVDFINWPQRLIHVGREVIELGGHRSELDPNGGPEQWLN